MSTDLEGLGSFYSKSTIGDVLQGTRLPKRSMLRDLVGYLEGDVDEWVDKLDQLLSPVPSREGFTSPIRAEFAAAVPRQLPNHMVDFTGRLPQLAELDRILAADDAGQAMSGPKVAAITGPGGIGKTTLALHWARRNANLFPDGQLYVNLQGFGPEPPLSPAAAIRELLTALGLDPRTIPMDQGAQSALYRNTLADKRILLVLDNASNSDQVIPLLSGDPGAAIVVTSRMQLGALAVRGTYPVAIGIFGDDEARHFLTNRLGDHRLAGEQGAVAALLEHCGGMPLALSIVAARAITQPHLPLNALAEELGDSTTRLDALSVGELDGDLRRVFSWSYRALPPEAAQAFRLLSLVRGADVGLPAAAALLDLGSTAARAVLRLLVMTHLVQEHAPNRFSMHELVRLFAAERLRETETTEEQSLAMYRVCHWYLRAADSSDRLLAPYRTHVLPDLASAGHQLDFDSQEQAMQWYETEHTNLLAMTRLAAVSAHPALAWQLAIAAFGYYRTCQNWREWVEILSIALEAARRARSVKGEAWTLNGLGIALTALGRYDEAANAYGPALTLRRRIGDRVGEAEVLNNLGEMCRLAGRYQQAIEHLQADYATCLEVNDRYGQAVSLNNLGKALLNIAEPAEALEAQLKALALCRDINEPYCEAEVHYALGEIYQTLVDSEAAGRHYRLAQEIAGKLGNLLTAAKALIGLGEIAAQLGQSTMAARYAQQAAAMTNRVNGTTTEGLDTRIQELLDRHRPDNANT